MNCQKSECGGIADAHFAQQHVSVYVQTDTIEVMQPRSLGNFLWRPHS